MKLTLNLILTLPTMLDAPGVGRFEAEHMPLHDGGPFFRGFDGLPRTRIVWLKGNVRDGFSYLLAW